MYTIIIRYLINPWSNNIVTWKNMNKQRENKYILHNTIQLYFHVIVTVTHTEGSVWETKYLFDIGTYN